MGLFKKKKHDDDQMDLSVIEDYKEPFTWANFWDEQIFGRYQKMKVFLDEKGILFFLMSPFQFRNRLITKLVIIVLGILIGVVPRTMSLIDQTKKRNSQDEFSQIVGKGFGAELINVRPLMSSHYKETHLLAFSIDGATKDGVPSLTDKYDVKLTENRGVADGEKVKYRYTVIPFTSDQRLLLVYVDTKKQDDFTGIFNLEVNIKGTKRMKAPMEIVLSDTQKTTKLYDESGIHMSALSRKLGSDENQTPIKEAESAVKDALDKYENNYDRVSALTGLDGKNYEVAVTRPALEEFIQAYTVLPTLTDKSTSAEVVKLEAPIPVVLPQVVSSLVVDGKTFTDESTSYETTNTTVDPSSTDAIAELATLTEYTKGALNAVSNLNSVRLSYYETLMSLSRVLNQNVNIDKMTEGGKVVPYINDASGDSSKNSESSDVKKKSNKKSNKKPKVDEQSDSSVSETTESGTEQSSTEATEPTIKTVPAEGLETSQTESPQ